MWHYYHRPYPFWQQKGIVSRSAATWYATHYRDGQFYVLNCVAWQADSSQHPAKRSKTGRLGLCSWAFLASPPPSPPPPTTSHPFHLPAPPRCPPSPLSP